MMPALPAFAFLTSYVLKKSLEDFKSRRAQGEPLQYILNRCDFMGLPFQVDSRVLIPRPETEILVENILNRIIVLCSSEYNLGNTVLMKRGIKDQNLQILDIGTGSGNIAVSLAKFLPNSRITAIDFSKGCLDLATLNAKMNGVSDRIQFIESNLFSSLHHEHFQQKFDILVSNPPYIPTGHMAQLPLDVQWEPPQALDGGGDGLEFYRRIFNGCADYLKSRALILLEFGADQITGLKEILKQYPFLRLLEVQKDLCLRDRVFVVQFEGQNL